MQSIIVRTNMLCLSMISYKGILKELVDLVNGNDILSLNFFKISSPNTANGCEQIGQKKKNEMRLINSVLGLSGGFDEFIMMNF